MAIPCSALRGGSVLRGRRGRGYGCDGQGAGIGGCAESSGRGAASGDRGCGKGLLGWWRYAYNVN
jgi:hypothetical protein